LFQDNIKPFKVKEFMQFLTKKWRNKGKKIDFIALKKLKKTQEYIFAGDYKNRPLPNLS
jgi:hypothetical protein